MSALSTALRSVAVVAILATTAAAQPQRFELEVSPRLGTTQDRFQATVTIQLTGVHGHDGYWHPDLDGFTLLDTQTRHSTAMTHDPVKGRQISTTEIRTYVLAPKQEGKLEIGPARMRLAGVDYKTAKISVDVQSPSAGSAAGSAGIDPDPTAAGGVGAPGYRDPEVEGSPDAFLHAVIDKTDPYVGEQVVVTWLLFARDEVLKFEPTLPRLDDLWSETLYDPARYLRYHNAYLGGARYRVAIAAKRALFPTRAGTIEIEPFRAEVQTLYSSGGNVTDLASKSLTLEVKELPPGAPPGFDPSYVGTFAAEASVDRTELEAGESLTLTLRVFGQGALRRTTPPALETNGFSFRKPRDFDEQMAISGDVVRGERIYRYWTTPKQGGTQTIGALEIPYFDPQSGSYQVARTEPITLVIHGDPGAVTGGNGGTENFIAPDIRLIREGSSISSVTLSRAYKALWYWMLVGLPVLGFLGLWAFDRWRRGHGGDSARSRRRRTRGSARKRFKAADIHLRGDRPSEFFAELARAIYEHIEERVGRPVHSLTRPELRALLAETGYSDDLIDRIDDELQNCDFARFTPAASGPSDMREARDRTQALLRELERVPRASSSAEEQPS